jgi:hypothetical protein
MSKPVEGQSAQSLEPMLLKAKAFATSQTGILLICCALGLGLLQLFSSDKKGKTATGYWAGAKEKTKAAKQAAKQMAKTTRNNVSLYIGCPAKMRQKLHEEWQTQGLIKKNTKPPKGKTSTLYVQMLNEE